MRQTGEPRHYIDTIPSFEINHPLFITFAAVARTDSQLIKEHTSLSLAEHYCRRGLWPFEHLLQLQVSDFREAKTKLLKYLREHEPVLRERWTCFYHMTFINQGGFKPTLNIACRDEVDRMMFRMGVE